MAFIYTKNVELGSIYKTRIRIWIRTARKWQLLKKSIAQTLKYAWASMDYCREKISAILYMYSAGVKNGENENIFGD
jgi:hypothetical protein